MAIQEMCQWLNQTSVSVGIRESIYLFPFIEGTHLLGCGVSAGTIAISDLRLLGWNMQKHPASRVMGALLPFTIVGFIIMMVTGGLLFWAEPIKAWGSLWFKLKLVFMVLAGLNALIFHTTIYRHMDQWDLDLDPPLGAKLAGVLSIALWALVIWSGRTTAYNI
jgi:hypothetical protein